jgi:hypothetical protein
VGAIDGNDLKRYGSGAGARSSRNDFAHARAAQASLGVRDHMGIRQQVSLGVDPESRAGALLLLAVCRGSNRDELDHGRCDDVFWGGCTFSRAESEREEDQSEYRRKRPSSTGRGVQKAKWFGARRHISRAVSPVPSRLLLRRECRGGGFQLHIQFPHIGLGEAQDGIVWFIAGRFEAQRVISDG